MKRTPSNAVFVLVALCLATSLWGQTSGARVSSIAADATELRWQRMPGSSMDSVHNPAVDNVFSGAMNSWEKIQFAWSGGVCLGNELFVWGGGHGNGAHNGLLALNVVNGKWRRVTEPSPIWTEATCPGGVCKTSSGNCPLGRCNVGPDGRPVARHTYYMLTTDGSAVYSSGGSIWSSGTSGDGPSSWRFDLATRQWRFLPGKNPILRPHGSAVQVGSKIYQMTGKGFAVMESSTGVWSHAGSTAARGGATGLVYVPTTNRIYALGDGEASFVDRSKWGASMTRLSSPPALVSQKGIGITYSREADLILLWNGGPRIITLDPRTNSWGELVPSGDPGPALENGTYGRFSYCGGRAVVVSGTNRDVYYVDLSGAVVEPIPEPTPPIDPTYSDRPPTVPPAPEPTNPSEPAPPATITPAPYYAEPPGDALVRAQCGPESDWDIIDIHTTSDAENLRRLISSDTRAVVRVHWRPKPYPSLVVKKGRCIKVVGIPGPDGERPLVTSVNATKAFRGEVRPGGLIVQNLVVSAGKAESITPGIGATVADCVGVPNDQMFFIIRDTEVSRCGHHAFVAAHAHQLYVEIGRSFFAQASSHLAYINHVAMAYVYDSAFESPGWGHALRCIALRCRIERTKVSNVQLNGSVLPTGGSNPLQRDRVYIGMAPLEVYTCGENEVRDVEAVFRSDQQRNSQFAAIVRPREGFRTCDVGEVAKGQWTRLMWGDPDFFDKRRWATVTPLVTKIERMQVTCVGPNPCIGWEIKGSYPVMDDAQKAELKKWLKTASFATWDDMLRAIPDTRPEWRWIASVTLPKHRSSFLRSAITNKVPLPVPIPGWFQRTRVQLKDLYVPGGQLLRPDDEADTYCYGTPPRTNAAGDLTNECSEQVDGAHYNRGFIEFR